MDALPAFEIGLWNVWLLMIIFPLQWLFVILFRGKISQRTGHPKDINTTGPERLLGKLTNIIWTGASLYSIFLPLKTGSPWLYAGLGLFIAGLAILVLATVQVYRTEESQPFTGGIYRFSRHPMYLSMILIYLGVSIASASWLFFTITVITFFLQNFQTAREEKYCCAQFGEAYRLYAEQTPKWL